MKRIDETEEYYRKILEIDSEFVPEP